MKTLSFLLLFMCVGFASLHAQTIQLPNACKKILDKNFRGWKLGKIPKEVSAYHKERKFPFEPNLIKGDWNGDAKIDYAILIRQGKLKNSDGRAIGDQCRSFATILPSAGKPDSFCLWHTQSANRLLTENYFLQHQN